MLSVILPKTDEPTVVEMTRDNLKKELKSIPGIELLVVESWEEGIRQARNTYVCIVEPDCLVSAGYFQSNLNLFIKNNHYRKLAMVASCVGANNWGNRIINFHMAPVESQQGPYKVTSWYIRPDREKRSTTLYPVQVGFIPGAIIRRSAMADFLTKHKKFIHHDPVQMSTQVCFYFWNTNRRVHVNPNTTYVSTFEGLENPAAFNPKIPSRVASIFENEMI